MNGGQITRQCSGPSRRVSFLWFERRRGAGSATDRPRVTRDAVAVDQRLKADDSISRLDRFITRLLAALGGAVIAVLLMVLLICSGLPKGVLSSWSVGTLGAVLIYLGLCLGAGLVGAVVGLLLPRVFSKPGEWIAAFFCDDDTSSWSHGN